MSGGKPSRLGWLIAIILVGGAIVYSQNSSRYDSRSRGSGLATKTPLITATPSPIPTATPKPYNAYNGEQFRISDYEGVCTFTVEASSLSNHYIYLQYVSEPAKSVNARTLCSSAVRPYESDMAFYVKKDSKATVKVPIGDYKLFYASGDTFFGEKLLFGDSTSFFSSDSILSFYSDEEYVYGHTVTLTTVINGNLDTDPIPESQFPGR